MRIGIDCRLWNETGVGRYIRNLVGQLLIIDRKNSYVLFVLSKDKENIKYQISKIKKNWKLEIGNWKLITADIRWHTIEEQLRFSQILNRENLDLMHFPYISVPIFYNKPFIVTIHDLIPFHFSTGEASTRSLPLYKLKFLGYKFILSAAAKKAKKIIAVSNTTKDEIIDHLKVDPSKVEVTHEGVFEKSKVKSQKSKVQVKIQNYFLYVGNAYPHKNLDRLIEAYVLFCHPERSEGSMDSSSVSRRTQNDTKLILVGREDYFYKRLEEKVKNMGLEKSVIFLGKVSDEELGSLYKNAKALIMPSLMEGFGLPALEAMANKCLVLASNIPALREVCDYTAVYFDPYDVKDMASKLEYVCSNDSNHFTQNIKKGLERTRMFSWQKMAKETLKIYEICAKS